jgi:uroporphyrinogen-III synthase
MPQKTILITRPEPGATATAKRLESMGHYPILAPCLTITRLDTRLPESPAAIIITSSQAIPSLPTHYAGTKIFCVGDATAARLKTAGFLVVESANGDATDLFRLIRGKNLPGTHLLITGQGHGLDLTAQLRSKNTKIIRRTVYAAKPAKFLSPEATTALAEKKIQAALFYSAESARAFTRLNPPNTATIEALALSPAVAAALDGLPWTKIRVALAPTEMDLLALIK